jgi:hypothetical protein
MEQELRAVWARLGEQRLEPQQAREDALRSQALRAWQLPAAQEWA